MPGKQPPEKPCDKELTVQQSFKMVFDMTTRIDDKLEKFMDNHHDLTNRVTILESDMDQTEQLEKDVEALETKVQLLEVKTESLKLKADQADAKMNQYDTRTNQIFDWVLRILFMLLGGYLLYKLGWQSPPTP